MARLDLLLFLTTLGAVAVVGVAMGVLMPRIATVEERAQAALGDLGAELDGTVRAIRTVKSSRAERRRLTSLLRHADASRDWSLRSVRIQASSWTIAGLGIDGAVIVVLAVGAARVAGGQMTVAALVAFLLYVWGLMGPVSELTSNLTTLQSGVAAAGRILEIEQLPLERDEGAPSPTPPGVPASAPAPVVELAGVTARYGPQGHPALRDVDLAIPARGHVALVGPSGAGKTTVLNLLMRFLEPATGHLRLRGVPYADLDHETVRGAFAYVEQETPVIPGTIGDNLRFSAPHATDAEIAEVLRRLHLDTFVSDLPAGLDTPLTDTSTSGGQRQRIALARALLADPEVLLLDEATAQVDGLTEAAIQVTVAERARRGAVVTIAHRLSTVLDADLIVVLDAGRVVARGDHPRLLRTSALYRDLVRALRIAPGPAVETTGSRRDRSHGAGVSMW